MQEHPNNVRWLTLRTEQGFYILLDGAPGALEARGDEFVSRTGHRSDQLVFEFLAVACYHFGNAHGRFQGKSWNTIMPLVVEDHWLESAEPGIRTWHTDSDGYTFYPYTLADLRAVTRCGSPEVTVCGVRERFIARPSLGGEGVAFIGASPRIDETILKMLEGIGISVVRAFQDLAEYIAPDGTLTY